MVKQKHISPALPAEESKKVKKLRQKIEKNIEDEKKNVTVDALRDMSAKIYSWLARQKESRIPLTERKITYFSNNEHPAPIQSETVKSLMKQLRASLEHQTPPPLESEKDNSSKTDSHL